jgi:hypothetical protein
VSVSVSVTQELENSGVGSCRSSERNAPKWALNSTERYPLAQALESWRKSNANGTRSLLALALALALALTLTLIPPFKSFAPFSVFRGLSESP